MTRVPAAAEDRDDSDAIRILFGPEHLHCQSHSILSPVDYIALVSVGKIVGDQRDRDGASKRECTSELAVAKGGGEDHAAACLPDDATKGRKRNRRMATRRDGVVTTVDLMKHPRLTITGTMETKRWRL
jgi:hypothetical protein